MSSKIVNLKLAIMILAAGWLQIVILPSLWPLRVKPDLLLICALVLAFRLESFTQLILSAFLCGLLKDIFSAHLLGFNAVTFCVYGSLVYYLSRLLYKENPWLEFAFLGCATLIQYFLLSIIFFRPYFFIGLIEAAVNCVFLFLLVRVYALK